MRLVAHVQATVLFRRSHTCSAYSRQLQFHTPDIYLTLSVEPASAVNHHDICLLAAGYIGRESAWVRQVMAWRAAHSPSKPNSPISRHRSTSVGKLLLLSTCSACGATTVCANSRTFSLNSRRASGVVCCCSAAHELLEENKRETYVLLAAASACWCRRAVKAARASCMWPLSDDVSAAQLSNSRQVVRTMMREASSA